MGNACYDKIGYIYFFNSLVWCMTQVQCTQYINCTAVKFKYTYIYNSTQLSSPIVQYNNNYYLYTVKL